MKWDREHIEKWNYIVDIKISCTYPHKFFYFFISFLKTYISFVDSISGLLSSACNSVREYKKKKKKKKNWKKGSKSQSIFSEAGAKEIIHLSFIRIFYFKLFKKKKKEEEKIEKNFPGT